MQSRHVSFIFMFLSFDKFCCLHVTGGSIGECECATSLMIIRNRKGCSYLNKYLKTYNDIWCISQNSNQHIVLFKDKN